HHIIYTQNRITNNSITTQQQNNEITEEQRRAQEAQQAQQLKQRAQESTQQALQNQQRVEQERKGKRRRHEPENEAHHCIDIVTNEPGFGYFKNKCNFKVWYNFCNFNPKKDSWAEAHNCVGRSGNAGDMIANGASAAHVKNTQTVYFYACKDPSWPVDSEYVAGQGLAARCHTVGGN
ncbi:MAG TPA: hypothetical protein PLH13_05495, partial [Burkholderiaceae bacterium]|nr:hypothetical protein [Burkholderiaceae bacterium]